MFKRILLLIIFLSLAAGAVLAQDYPPQVQKALDDLNQRLGLNLTLRDFNWRWSQETYQDSSLGCPISGQTYRQGYTIGYKVELFVNNLTWDYRLSSDLQTLILCSPLATPTPQPRPTNTPPAIPTRNSNATLVPAPTSCPGSPAFRLTVGLQAQVVPSGLPNNVRQEPSTSTRLVGELQPGDVFYVLDGPRCASGLTWWYIAATTSDLVGWTPEGLGETYWLKPVTQFGFAIPTFSGSNFGQATGTPIGGTYRPTPTPIGGIYRPTPTRAGGSFYPTATPSFAPNFIPDQPPPLFAPTTSATACTLLTRLVIGGKARVTPGLPNNVRQQPGTSSAYVGEIPVGGVVSVLDGPICASGTAWWLVTYNNITGWTPEGQGKLYWLEPVNG